MAETRQQYQGMHPITRSVQKNNAKNILAMQKPTPEVHQEGVDEEMKLQKVKDAINSVQNHTQLTPEQKKAIVAGTTRAWYADLPGAATDVVGMGVDYLTEGLKALLPSGDMVGYDVAKSLGLNAVQEGARDPFLGSKHLEEFGVNAGYIPPTTGTDLETYARIGAGFFDPVPIPMTAGVFASNRAKNLPKMSLAKAQKMEKGFNKNAKYPLTPYTKQEIFDDTGFFKGPDGEWRFEISDKDMKVNQEFLKTKTDLWGKEVYRGPGYDQGQTYGKLSDAIDHPELFKAYPELEDVYLKFIPPGSDELVGSGGLHGSYNDAGEMVPISNTPKSPPGGFKTAGEESDFNAAIGEKVPEKYAKVIMVVAPTRQREIKRLELIVDDANLDVSLGSKRVALAKSVIAEGGDLKYTGLESAGVMLEEAQKSLKQNLPELERLKAGGQPDLNFSVKSTITHEIQHAIQGIEDLPRGGNAHTAYRETEDAVLGPLKAKAKEKFPNQGSSGLPEQKRLYDEKLRDMSMMDDVQYLQQLQKFINSDNPTRNARYIESSSYSYEVSNSYDMKTWLGPRPNKRKTKEYTEYLRKKALLYQHIVIDKYVAGRPLKRSADMTQFVSQNRSYRFGELIADLVGYTEGKGTATHSKAIGDQFKQGYINNCGEPADWESLKGIPGVNRVKDTPFDPNKIYNDRPSNIARRWDVSDYDQPNWLSLGEKNVKNYVSRLARSADKHAEAAGMQTQIEMKLKGLQEKSQIQLIQGNKK